MERDKEIHGQLTLSTFVSGNLAGKVEETCGVERSSSGGLAEEPFQHVGQSWSWFQVENEPEERCDGLALWVMK